MPHLERFKNKYAEKGLQVYCVSIADAELQKRMTSEENGNMRQSDFPAQNRGWKAYQAMGGGRLPMTVVVDRQGRVRYRHGAFLNGMPRVVAYEIETLLNEDSIHP